MDNPIMFRTRLMSVLIASVIGSSFGHVLPASAADGDAERGAAPVQLTQARHEASAGITRMPFEDPGPPESSTLSKSLAHITNHGMRNLVLLRFPVDFLQAW